MKKYIVSAAYGFDGFSKDIEVSEQELVEKVNFLLEASPIAEVIVRKCQNP